MISAMYSSISQIKSAEYGLRTIGSNLSLINTTAAKGSRTGYMEMGSQFIKGAQGPTTKFGGTNPVSIGFGAVLGSTDIDTRPGALNPTGIPTDLAIDGEGYFIFSNGESLVYSRDGALKKDANGDLCHAATGFRILGWPADSAGTINTSSSITPTSLINLPVGISGAAQQTTTAVFQGNLSSTAGIGEIEKVELDTYDSLGNLHKVLIRFTGHSTEYQDAVTFLPATGIPPAAVTDNAASKWTWTANLINADGTETAIGDSTTAGNGPLYYDNAGLMINNANFPGIQAINIPAASGAASTPILLNFTGIRQLGNSTQLTVQKQDGYGAGSLKEFTVGSDGIIGGSFSTGFNRPLGQIAVVTFSNPSGLQKVGNNMWINTDNSGTPVIGIANTGGRGIIKTGFLERSNIDFGEQFTSIITEQRGTQANTKMISTVDELTSDIINMKR